MARLMIAMAVSAIGAAAYLYVAAPGFMGGGIEPSLGSYAIYGLALVGVVGGLAWMIRIYRADPEPDQAAWRYRAKR